MPSGLTKDSFPCSSFSTIQPSGTVVSNIQPSGTLSSASILCHKFSGFVQGCDMTGFLNEKFVRKDFHFSGGSLILNHLKMSNCMGSLILRVWVWVWVWVRLFCKKMWFYFCLCQDMTRYSNLNLKWKKIDFGILTNTIFS